MPATPLEPLGSRHRRFTFFLLLILFVVAFPLLYLYATGYRFNPWGDTNFISTGGIFISAERTGSEIYIDNELVRETRVFRRAFYAQNLDPGTHRVHVQREGSHTWVKELPVYPHLVTEAQAFNMPLVPEARVIANYTTQAGAPVLFRRYAPLASSTQEFFNATTTATSTFRTNTEFVNRVAALFPPAPVRTTRAATTTATTTKEHNGVRLFQSGDDVYASFVGNRENMPYYYCAEPFPLLGTSTAPILTPMTGLNTSDAALSLYGASGAVEATDADMLQVEERSQEVAPDQECKPNIRIDRKGEQVTSFDFFPNTTDIVVMARESGVYAVEVDDRAWQNVQPIMEGTGLRVAVAEGRIYIYDGTVIYEMIVE